MGPSSLAFTLRVLFINWRSQNIYTKGRAGDMAMSFAKDIKPLFRKTDVSSMIDNGGFDLSKFEDVKKHMDV